MIFDEFYLGLCTQKIKKASKIISKKLNFPEFFLATGQ